MWLLNKLQARIKKVIRTYGKQFLLDQSLILFFNSWLQVKPFPAFSICLEYQKIQSASVFHKFWMLFNIHLKNTLIFPLVSSTGRPQKEIFQRSNVLRTFYFPEGLCQQVRNMQFFMCCLMEVVISAIHVTSLLFFTHGRSQLLFHVC